MLEKLIDEQQILDKLDPAILIGQRFGLWPDDQEMINVRTLADYFTQLTHLPMLLGRGVLPDCLAEGVQRGLFGYALGDGEKKQFDTILFDKTSRPPTECEIIESAWLLRPALAKSLMPEPEPVGTWNDAQVVGRRPATSGGWREASRGGGGDEWPTTGGGVKIVEGRAPPEQGPHRHEDSLGELERHLQRGHRPAGAGRGRHALRCRHHRQGRLRDPREHRRVGIKESLSQRGMKADIQTG